MCLHPSLQGTGRGKCDLFSATILGSRTQYNGMICQTVRSFTCWMTKRMIIMHSYIAALHEGTEMRKEKKKNFLKESCPILGCSPPNSLLSFKNISSLSYLQSCDTYSVSSLLPSMAIPKHIRFWNMFRFDYGRGCLEGGRCPGYNIFSVVSRFHSDLLRFKIITHTVLIILPHTPSSYSPEPYPPVTTAKSPGIVQPCQAPSNILMFCSPCLHADLF